MQVYYTLEMLGLFLVRRSTVGNEDVKGVSGGQVNSNLPMKHCIYYNVILNA